MTTQRDRLIALLDAVTDETLADLREEDLDRYFEMVADALLARGVRVVDTQLLTEAIRLNLKVVRLDGMTLEESVIIDGVEYWRRHPIADKLAEAVLGTLDSER